MYTQMYVCIYIYIYIYLVIFICPYIYRERDIDMYTRLYHTLVYCVILFISLSIVIAGNYDVLGASCKC